MTASTESAGVVLTSVDQVAGVWRRSLLRSGTVEDRATSVTWLQAGARYVDLRQPSDRPSFAGVSSLSDLTAEQLSWLLRQEGFAGTLSCADAIFTWHRDVDLQPPAAVADAGRLLDEGSRVVEVGVLAPYIEHWHRDASPRSSGSAVLRHLGTGRDAVLVRVDDRFGWAHDRRPALDGASLTDLAADGADPHRLLDCSLSLGVVQQERWTVQRSSLPFLEQRPLTLAPADWAVIDLTGDLAPPFTDGS